MGKRTLNQWINLCPNERAREIFTGYVRNSYFDSAKRLGFPKDILKGIMRAAWNTEYETFEKAVGDNINLEIVPKNEMEALLSLTQLVKEHTELMKQDDFANRLLSTFKFGKDEK